MYRNTMGDLVNSKLPQNPDLGDINFDFPKGLCHPNLGFEENLDRGGGAGGCLDFFWNRRFFFLGHSNLGYINFLDLRGHPIEASHCQVCAHSA